MATHKFPQDTLIKLYITKQRDKGRHKTKQTDEFNLRWNMPGKLKHCSTYLC